MTHLDKVLQALRQGIDWHLCRATKLNPTLTIYLGNEEFHVLQKLAYQVGQGLTANPAKFEGFPVIRVAEQNHLDVVQSVMKATPTVDYTRA